MNTTLVKPEFPLLRRLSRDIDTFFDRFGLDRPLTLSTEFAWTPDLEVFEKGNEFIVKADVPGMKREDIKVELTDNELTISGERKMEKEEKEKGFYRTERSYGSFFRTITLPEGVKTKDAKAVVRDGVLEVKMPMAKIEETKRRLEIAA
jgi:HSP20 family protein